MEKTTCLLLDESEKDRASLISLLKAIDFVEIVGSTNNFKEGLTLVNELEPNLLFLDVKGDGAAAYKFIEKIKKQPTIVFLTDDDANVKTFSANRLHYLKKPVTAEGLTFLLNSFQQTHQQLADKMKGLLGQLKLEN
ncbi:LytR/AlgR family response regulator transcription factor [Pedobacter arcticus]|uniref:LytR/AlgR family response regulator transcription factor n=1 Tax=Pedobacter arcticus TaxID=752140 RepID=UPI00137620F7|nr:response regulator [Pedobacter arcticus]